MDKAVVTPDEFERLKELLSYDIMGTDPEMCFDDITELASHVCAVPIALVSLIDETRQWFKSNHGIEERETPREISFCGHAIQQSGIFEVSDAREDKRFFDNPLVTGDFGLVFYAGCPLKSPKGYNLGTLCIIGREPKKMTESERLSLEVLARQVVSLMELRKKNKELRNLNGEIKKLSGKIQNQTIQLANSVKMASLGVMASGISHEINNPLAMISMITVSIKSALKKTPSEKISKEVGRIETLVVRISKIISGLEMFADRGSEMPLQKERLGDLVESALAVCGERFGKKGVKLTVEGSLDQKILCRRDDLSRVILNLLLNSFDAVESSSEKWIRLNASEDSKNIIVSVSDSGRGIDPEYADKIMDPFFTTKPTGSGRGLGLSASQGILKFHNGDLILDRTSKNTKFDMVLPKCA